MLSIVTDYIADSMAETMNSYTETEEHKSRLHEINEKKAALHSSLPEPQKQALHDLLEMISNADAIMAEQAYKIGFAQGVCFRDETIIK